MFELLPICQRLNTIQEGTSREMTRKDSKIDSALIINGKILKSTIPDPNKIKDGINNIILAIILSPIKF